MSRIYQKCLFVGFCPSLPEFPGFCIVEFCPTLPGFSGFCLSSPMFGICVPQEVPSMERTFFYRTYCNTLLTKLGMKFALFTQILNPFLANSIPTFLKYILSIVDFDFDFVNCRQLSVLTVKLIFVCCYRFCSVHKMSIAIRTKHKRNCSAVN